ncbi:transposase [Streptomyces sp. NEAU-174]|uniref:transposase n=1 Tax=Streptomyces sp. NEAU-174 TaxID=3458254 RepID=UPI0040439EB6
MRKPVRPTARRSSRPPGRPHQSKVRGCLSPRCCRRLLLVRKVVGPPRVTNRAVFTAVAFALTRGCAWRHLPPTFGTSPATAYRRFTVWTEAGLWRRPHRAVLDELGARGEVDWTSAVVDAASLRAQRGDR